MRPTIAAGQVGRPGRHELTPPVPHGQRGLVGLCGHGVQPHPRRRHDHRARPGQSRHRHHPAQAHRGPRPDRHLSTATAPAPTGGLALGQRLDRTVLPRVRATNDRGDLTAGPSGHDTDQQWNTPAARPAPQPRPTANPGPQPRSGPAPREHRWTQVRSASWTATVRVGTKRRARPGVARLWSQGGESVVVVQHPGCLAQEQAATLDRVI